MLSDYIRTRGKFHAANTRRQPPRREIERIIGCVYLVHYKAATINPPLTVRVRRILFSRHNTYMTDLSSKYKYMYLIDLPDRDAKVQVEVRYHHDLLACFVGPLQIIDCYMYVVNFGSSA